MNNVIKRRILFVDDEPMVLKGLQRTLRKMRAEWDMSFVTSAAHALELMAEKPFDAIVADMRMPGMDGAQLLNEVKDRHPMMRTHYSFRSLGSRDDHAFGRSNASISRKAM